MRDYVRGLLAPVARKNSWQLAEQAGHPTPDGLQHLLAGSKWEPDDIRDDLQQNVADKLGEADGVLIIDDTGFITKATTSAGVQRQYSGTAGRTGNCQIGVFAAYASARGRALVDRELYLPKSWTEDRERCRTARIPDEREFATKGELARHMVLRALASPLPITWVTADSAYDQDNRFRRLLEQTGAGYVLAVPKSQFSVGCSQIEGLFAQAPNEAWEKISGGDGGKGPAPERTPGTTPRAELVELAPPTQSSRSPLSLPAALSHDRGAVSVRPPPHNRSPATLQPPNETRRSDSKVQLEY